MAVSRQQRRVRVKESVDHVARYGINLDDTPAQQMWSMIGLTRILIDILDSRALRALATRPSARMSSSSCRSSAILRTTGSSARRAAASAAICGSARWRPKCSMSPISCASNSRVSSIG